MSADPELFRKAAELDELAMGCETAVQPLLAEDYVKEFYDFYRIRDRKRKLIPSEDIFEQALMEVSGYDVWRPISEETERLFGLPKRVMVFDDVLRVRGLDPLLHLRHEQLIVPSEKRPFRFSRKGRFCYGSCYGFRAVRVLPPAGGARHASRTQSNLPAARSRPSR